MGQHKYWEINYEASDTDIVCAVPRSLVGWHQSLRTNFLADQEVQGKGQAELMPSGFVMYPRIASALNDVPGLFLPFGFEMRRSSCGG
jgi:hypothetical protein